MVRDFTFYVISVFACGNVMLLMLVIFGKFGSFLGVEVFKGGGGGGGGGADDALLMLYIYAIIYSGFQARGFIFGYRQ